VNGVQRPDAGGAYFDRPLSDFGCEIHDFAVIQQLARCSLDGWWGDTPAQGATDLDFTHRRGNHWPLARTYEPDGRFVLLIACRKERDKY
jgi:hypothetical protein